MLMNMELCLFCNEQVYKTDADYICGSCVQLLLEADQADLKQAHAKAIEKGYSNKVRAIESFLIPEDKINGQRKPVTKKRRRHTDRKGIVRPSRNKKERVKRSEIPSPATFL
jgi:hypothetical protein